MKKLLAAALLCVTAFAQAQQEMPPFTTSKFNGEIMVGGKVFPNLDFAWLYASAQATATGQNQTIHLGAGVYSVGNSADLNPEFAEPANGACISIIGSTAPGQLADTTQVGTIIESYDPVSGGTLIGTNGTQTNNNCTFRDLYILNENASTQAGFGYGITLFGFSGLTIENVAIEDALSSGITLADDTPGDTSTFYMRNVFISYNSAHFTPEARASYGINIAANVGDSVIDHLVVRNARIAAIQNDGSGITVRDLHGFGYPYTCSAGGATATISTTNESTTATVTATGTGTITANQLVWAPGIAFPTTVSSISGSTLTLSFAARATATGVAAQFSCNNYSDTSATDPAASFATNYVVLDNGGGGNSYIDTYMDSPAIAAFDLEANGVVVEGGHIQWPELTSFPNANLASVQNTMTSNLIIANVGCSAMSATAGAPSSPAGSTGVWISYFGTDGEPPSFSSVSNLAGCGTFYQTRNNSRQTVFDVTTNNSSNTNFGSSGETPKVITFPLNAQANEGGNESECFAGPDSETGDIYYGGEPASPSSFVVRCNGTIHGGGGLQTGAVSVSSATTLAYTNKNVMANASSAAFTLTLPSCFTPMPDGITPTGMELTIYKTDSSANAVTLATTSSQTITYNGTSYASGGLALGSSLHELTLVCGADSNWYAH